MSVWMSDMTVTGDIRSYRVPPINAWGSSWSSKVLCQTAQLCSEVECMTRGHRAACPGDVVSGVGGGAPPPQHYVCLLQPNCALLCCGLNVVTTTNSAGWCEVGVWCIKPTFATVICQLTNRYKCRVSCYMFGASEGFNKTFQTCPSSG